MPRALTWLGGIIDLRVENVIRSARVVIGVQIQLRPDAEDHAAALGEGESRGLDPGVEIRVAGSG